MTWDLWLEDAKPLMPVIVIQHPDDAVPMAQALVAGGVRMLEITLRSEYALAAIRQIKQDVPEAIVGVGTVTDTNQLEQAIQAGVEFAVSPGTAQPLLDCAHAWGGCYLPGVATPSDVMAALNAGFMRQKLFPASVVGGLSMLQALSGPFAEVMFCPTGGINASNYQAYLTQKNVFAVGGSWLTPAEAVQSGNWQAIKTLALAG